ncbi:hypothetical protein HZC00_01095 [Candidatus Kaiserbacteria bacterium]|nr:hypothetical protein [Candidatus Kaiserbacteria bacterium]
MLMTGLSQIATIGSIVAICFIQEALGIKHTVTNIKAYVSLDSTPSLKEAVEKELARGKQRMAIGRLALCFSIIIAGIDIFLRYTG